MKKFLVILLSLLLVFSLVACGETKEEGENTDPDPATDPVEDPTTDDNTETELTAWTLTYDFSKLEEFSMPVGLRLKCSYVGCLYQDYEGFKDQFTDGYTRDIWGTSDSGTADTFIDLLKNCSFGNNSHKCEALYNGLFVYDDGSGSVYDSYMNESYMMLTDVSLAVTDDIEKEIKANTSYGGKLEAYMEHFLGAPCMVVEIYDWMETSGADYFLLIFQYSDGTYFCIDYDDMAYYERIESIKGCWCTSTAGITGYLAQLESTGHVVYTDGTITL